jgi:hypothetical protein
MKLVNKTGYLKGTKTAKNSVNIIPSSLITTQGMAFPIKANGKTLYPNTGQYKFPTSPVVETPLKNKNQLDTSTTGPTINKANLLKGKTVNKTVNKTNNNSPKLGPAFSAKPKPFTWKPPKTVAEFEEAKKIGSSKTAGNKYKAEDTFKDNITEYLDPTGATSWDDVQRSIDKEGYSPTTLLEIAGAIPFYGKIPKLIKGQKLISQIVRTAIKGTGRFEKVSNAPELNESYQKGTKTIKYKKGSKGVSLALSRGEKDPKGGLTQKGVDKYNRATGGNLKMAVTTPPSKLKAGSKDANRRKSFCARMSGVKGPMKKPNGEPSRKALALRKWNC